MDQGTWFTWKDWASITIPEQAGVPPVIHRIEFENDGMLQLAVHFPLCVDLDGWEHVELWLADDREWQMVSTEGSFWVPEDDDYIYLRTPGLGVMVGFGRELNAMFPPRGVHKPKLSKRRPWTSLEVRRPHLQILSPLKRIRPRSSVNSAMSSTQRTM